MKPILFNTEMVRAILDGRKTVTRRVVKPQPTYSPRDGFTWNGYAYGTDLPPTIKGAGYNLCSAAPYKVNDILYVRETFFQAVGHYLDVSGESVSYTYPIFEYLADGKHTKGHWYDKQQSYYMVKRPSIHMPKEVARIFLKVTGVRVERLQDMKIEDCEREGLEDLCKGCAELFLCDGCMYEGGIIGHFEKLWDTTIKKDQLQYYSWDANPYVWVIEFEVIDKAAALKEGQA